MARGQRRTDLEKMNEELHQVREAFSSETQKLNNLRDREKELTEAIFAEETRQIKQMLEEKSMTMDELKSLISNYTPDNQQHAPSTHSEVA